MAKVCVRRYSEPVYVRALKEGVLKIVNQKQCPNEERIVRVTQQDFEWTKGEILKQLKLAVKDGFFCQVTAMSNHGSTKGIPQTAYRIKQSSEKVSKKESHDWYCWECHLPGEVILCDHCPRVFHRRCAHDGTVTANKWRCPSCQPPTVPALMTSKSVDELSQMLKFTLERMMEKAKDYLKPFSLDVYVDYLDFVFKPIDLSLLEKQVHKKHYKTAKEFREDAQWILHNALIYFGDDELTNLAEAIMEDCDGELEEMIRCPDCYIQSNARPQNWFCKPCYFPHELVWAKMTGEPPWPAKLLAWNDNQTRALVRFFGSAHQRAWVGNKYVTPITSKPEVKKRPQRWLQAIDEMQEYQKQLRKLYPDSKPEAEKPSKKSSLVTIETQTDPLVMGDAEESECKKRKLEDKNQEMKLEMEAMELEYETRIKCFKEKLNQQGIAHEKEMKEQSEQIEHHQDQVKLLNAHLKSAKDSLEKEMKQAKQLVDELKAREEENETLVSRAKEASHFVSGQNGIQNNNTNSLESIITEQTGMIQQLQAALEKEKQDTKHLVEQVAKTRDRDLQQAVKLAVNKERLERERALDDAMKRSADKSKQDRDKHVQQTLLIAKEEAEKSLQEAVALAKRKQWCAYCSSEAFYPCCWNTSYCTVECQKAHWCTHRFQCMRLACSCGRQCQGKNC